MTQGLRAFDPETGLRTCTKCGVENPECGFYSLGDGATNEDGLRADCKDCTRAARRRTGLGTHAVCDETERESVVYTIHLPGRGVWYVGSSYRSNLAGRMRAHMQKDWWSNRMEVLIDYFPTRAESYRAEQDTIRMLQPLMNSHHNGGSQHG